MCVLRLFVCRIRHLYGFLFSHHFDIRNSGSGVLRCQLSSKFGYDISMCCIHTANEMTSVSLFFNSSLLTYIFIHIYIYTCVCVCVCLRWIFLILTCVAGQIWCWTPHHSTNTRHCFSWLFFLSFFLPSYSVLFFLSFIRFVYLLKRVFLWLYSMYILLLLTFNSVP